MKCKCGGDYKTIDSRPKGTNVVKRRKECTSCKERIFTVEMPASNIDQLVAARVKVSKHTISRVINALSSIERSI